MQEVFLTSEETKIFQALPANLREGWAVQPETSTTYETDEMLDMRAQMAQISFQKYPELQELAKKAETAKSLEELSFPALPEDVLNEFFFTLGARGIEGMIGGLLPEIRTDDDVRSLASLTYIRHTLLDLNAKDLASL